MFRRLVGSCDDRDSLQAEAALILPLVCLSTCSTVLMIVYSPSMDVGSFDSLSRFHKRSRGKERGGE